MRAPKFVRRLVALKKADENKINYDQLMEYILPL
jgi:hypothetical protein